jgi:hypothetical protein
MTAPAISTFAQLKTSIEEWLIRVADPDVQGRSADFIALVEEDLNDRLRVKEMEVRARALLNEEYENLPTDTDGNLTCLEIINAKLIHPSGRITPLHPKSEKQITQDRSKYLDNSATNSSGFPWYYAIVGNQIWFYPVLTMDADADPSTYIYFELTYLSKIPSLSDSQTTNAILSKFPSLYLYGSLMQAAPYVYEDEKILIWNNLYNSGINRANEAYKRKNFPGSMAVSMPVEGVV